MNLVLRGNGPVTSDVILAPLQANDANQDFHPHLYGTVLQAYRNGLVSAAIDFRYSHDLLWEFEYSDTASNECLAVRSSPAQT